MARAVFMSEDDDWDSERNDTFFLGTFSGHVEDEGVDEEFRSWSLEDALAWGRERADRVYIRFGNTGYFSAGTVHPDDLPRWPPENLPTFERRRPEGEEWKDRTETDPPILWSVTVWLNPALDPLPADRRAWDEAAAVIAERAGAAGAEAHGVEEMMKAQRDAAEHRRRTGEHVGWTGYVPAYAVEVDAEAPTRQAAVASAIARCSPLPVGWQAGGDAVPAHNAPGRSD